MNPNFALLESEITYKASRSGGKGGQNVNKVSTKIRLEFDISQSKNLSEDQKQILLQKLENRISSEGVLSITAQTERTQLRNKKEALSRFYMLISEALHVEKNRKATHVPKRVIQKRWKAKKRKSDIKKLRQENHS